MRHPLRITYVTRSFLDYRVPVFEALSHMLNKQFNIIYSADYIPNIVNYKVKRALGNFAIGMTGERCIGPNEFPDFANTAFRVVYQPHILREIGKNKPHVLVGDGFFQWTSFALFYKIRNKIPLVVCYERTFHTERNAQWYRNAYRRFIVKYVDAITCSGKLSLEYVKWLGMPESKITTGHMVADTKGMGDVVASLSQTEREGYRKKWGSQKLIFLAASRLNKRKGIKELLLGWSLLEKVVPENGKLIIIGVGPEEEALKFLAQELGLSSVHFLGPVLYDDIARYYAAADVFVMPTLEDNWSLVVPEAMACGLPVLCSRYNGCYPELIDPAKNGWVFDPLDKEDTFRALMKCFQNKARLKQMGKRSMEIVSRHTPEHAARAIVDACNIAIANNKYAFAYRS